MKISARTGRALHSLQFQRKRSIEELARELKVRPHTIRYDLARLMREEVIRPAIVINSFLLGIQQFQFYVSLSFATPKSQTRLKNRFDRSPQIAWYAQLAGRYQFGCSVCANTAIEAQRLLETLLQPGSTLVRRTIGTVVSIDLVSKQYLDQKARRSTAISLDSTAPVLRCDPLDISILRAIAAAPDLPVQRIAEKLGVPRTTIGRHLAALESDGILCGWVYLINARKLNRQTYRLLVTFNSSSDELRNDLRRFALLHPAVVACFTMVGAWDIELSVEVESPLDLTLIIDQIATRVGSALLEVEVLHVLEQRQPASFNWGL